MTDGAASVLLPSDWEGLGTCAENVDVCVCHRLDAEACRRPRLAGLVQKVCPSAGIHCSSSEEADGRYTVAARLGLVHDGVVVRGLGWGLPVSTLAECNAVDRISVAFHTYAVGEFNGGSSSTIAIIL